MHAAERECTRTTDVCKDIHSGGAATHSGGATTDACSCVPSADARDVVQDALSGIHEDANSIDASTDARISSANINACGCSPGDTDSTIMPVSHLTRGTKVFIPLLMKPRTESSSRPCQLEHARSTQPCTKSSSQPVSVSLSTCDNAIQTNKIETSADSADVTTQSASSADSTKTPANSATTEMQMPVYANKYEAQQMLHEAQLKLQEVINRDNQQVYARLTSTVPPPGEYATRPSRKAIQLAEKARKLICHSRLQGGDGSNASINYLVWRLMDEEHAAANKRLCQSLSEALACGRPCLHDAEYNQLLRNCMTVEQHQHHLEQNQKEKEQRGHTDRVCQQLEHTQQTPISQAPISTPHTSHISPDGGSGVSESIPLAQEARKFDAIEKVNETCKRNQKKEIKRETKIATHASTLPSALAKARKTKPVRRALRCHIAKVHHQSAGHAQKHSCLATLSSSI